MARIFDENVRDSRRPATMLDPRLEGRLPSAVLFDFNGTLSDDEPIVFAAYRNAFAEVLDFDMDKPFYDMQLVGRSDREMIEITLNHHELPAYLAERLLDARRSEYQRMAHASPPIGDDVIEFVQELTSRGVLLGVVTGAERADVEFVLGTTPLSNEFNVIVAQEDVVNGKPDPEGYLLGLEKLGADPSETVIFEDSLVGMAAARLAGCASVAVEGSHPRAELLRAADAVIGHLDIGAISVLREVADRTRSKVARALDV